MNITSPVRGTAQGGNGDYGYRTHPVTGKAGDFHAGLDVACPIGTPILAPEPGVIAFAGWAGTHPLTRARSGIAQVLRGDWTGRDWYFGHLDTFYVGTGTRVEHLAHISDSGATGNVSGPHVHLEIRKAGTLTTEDPTRFLLALGVEPGSAPPTRGITAPDPQEDDDMTPDQVQTAARLALYNLINEAESRANPTARAFRDDLDAILINAARVALAGLADEAANRSTPTGRNLDDDLDQINKGELK